MLVSLKELGEKTVNKIIDEFRNNVSVAEITKKYLVSLDDALFLFNQAHKKYRSANLNTYTFPVNGTFSI